MARVKTGPSRRKRHKKVLKQTKGYRMTKNRLYKVAHEALLHALDYAYIGRKQKKRNFRKLWIKRINITLRGLDDNYKYSTFIAGLKDKDINLNRKMLADLAVRDPDTFAKVAEKAYK